MTAPPVLVLRAAGTNCDAEAVRAFEMAGGRVEKRHLDEAIARPALLREAAILCFPGGFTYGDDVASGAVFAVKVKVRLLPELRRAVDDGRLVLGVCNGFQILVRTGLLPGLSGQVVVRYAMPAEAAPGTYPHNPNGSVDDIAGVCDPTGRVLGLMPHPERNVLPWQHPGAGRRPAPEGTASGLRVFENAIRWAREHG